MTWEMIHFLVPNFAPSTQKFGGGKILVKDFLNFMTLILIHFLVPNFEILPLVCKIEFFLLLRIYVLSSVLCRGVCVGVWVCGCVGVWVCIQNRKVQNSLRSVGNCFAISSSAALDFFFDFLEKKKLDFLNFMTWELIHFLVPNFAPSMQKF
jgi:hypothetical protein